MNKALIAIAAMLASTEPALADTVVVRQVTIRVNDGDRIEEYYPVDDLELLLRARDGNKWYSAMLEDDCKGITRALGTAPGLTIESARQDGTIGSDSVLQAGSVVCQISRLYKHDGPNGLRKDRITAPPAALRKVIVTPRR